MNQNMKFYGPVRRFEIQLEPSAQGSAIIERGIRIFRDRIAKRCAATLSARQPGFTITLSVDTSIGDQGFRICSDAASASIVGNCELAVLYGLGKFLHTSGYTSDGFHPSCWQGMSVPTSPFRTIQMDTHF